MSLVLDRGLVVPDRDACAAKVGIVSFRQTWLGRPIAKSGLILLQIELWVLMFVDGDVGVDGVLFGQCLDLRSSPLISV